MFEHCVQNSGCGREHDLNLVPDDREHDLNLDLDNPQGRELICQHKYHILLTKFSIGSTVSSTTVLDGAKFSTTGTLV